MTRPVKPKSKIGILDLAIPLFAQSGYAGVSMRDIASVVGIRAASLYHHFPDKQTLYLQAMARAFEDKAQGFAEVLTVTGTPEKRLAGFVQIFTSLMSKDPEFRALLQRELLDGDEARLKLLAREVFREPFIAMEALADELAPGCDAHMVAISKASLILYHLETAPLRRYLPGGKAKHNKPAVIADHVTRLLLNGLKGCGQ
ncbi:MAG: TetR/AcrR family transcriptional regulator [Pseudomonadota bacterium]|nr:TetR/AcrR family transcriptional regulator [Pseudomonadota bacterium]